MWKNNVKRLNCFQEKDEYNENNDVYMYAQ